MNRANCFRGTRRGSESGSAGRRSLGGPLRPFIGDGIELVPDRLCVAKENVDVDIADSFTTP
jgi:hypothetical protein